MYQITIDKFQLTLLATLSIKFLHVATFQQSDLSNGTRQMQLDSTFPRIHYRIRTLQNQHNTLNSVETNLTLAIQPNLSKREENSHNPSYSSSASLTLHTLLFHHPWLETRFKFLFHFLHHYSILLGLGFFF